MLKELIFKNYRCFENNKIIFKDLSVIVGKNNAGKSTVIEALRIISTVVNKCKNAHYMSIPKSFNLSIEEIGIKVSVEHLKIDLRGIVNFYKDSEAKLTAIFTNNIRIVVTMNKEIVFANIYDENGGLVNSKKRAKEIIIEPIGIMPPLGLIKEQEKLLTSDTVKNDIDTYLASRHFRNELLLFKNEKFNEFKNVAEETWKGLKVIDLDYDISRSEYIQLLIQDAGFPAEIGIMGSGIQMWLQIVWFICRLNQNSTVILDEPDVYMHPDLQQKILRIVKSKYKQVIIATHSIEIISDVNAKNILKIDKMTRRMNYATDLKGVQNIVDNIGSVQNLSLIRLGDSKRCLFVEGKDVKMLSKYYEILYPNGDAYIEMVPWISLGGWTRFSEALGTSRLFHEETKGDIRTICILDRDYHLEDEINKLQTKAKDSHLELHVWSRKEIENYLLNPKVIFRLTGLDCNKYDEFYKSLNSEIDVLKDDVIDHYAQEIKKIHSNKEHITANREARKFVDSKWNSLEEKFDLVNGKEAISIINTWMKSKYKKSCSITKIFSKFKPEDVHEDVRTVLGRII